MDVLVAINALEDGLKSYSKKHRSSSPEVQMRLEDDLRELRLYTSSPGDKIDVLERMKFSFASVQAMIM